MLINNRILIKYVIREIWIDLLYSFALSLIVILITERYQTNIPSMPLTIPAFVGTAISILLSFKLSQSYDRWWEARKIWGGIVNDSRSLVIQLKTLVQGDNDATIKRIAFRQVAWCYSLGQSLRRLDPLMGIDHLLSPEDLHELEEQENKPLAILNKNALEIKTLKDNHQLELFAQLQIDETLVRLCEAQGKAERIKNTVFPVTYRKMLHFMIFIFVATLSVALEDVAGFFEIPLLLVFAGTFFLLEQSATRMQDPFENLPTDIPVTSIAITIERNVRQLLNEKSDLPQQANADFYIL